jgi:hypothetical protein
LFFLHLVGDIAIIVIKRLTILGGKIGGEHLIVIGDIAFQFVSSVLVDGSGNFHYVFGQDSIRICVVFVGGIGEDGCNAKGTSRSSAGFRFASFFLFEDFVIFGQHFHTTYAQHCIKIFGMGFTGVVSDNVIDDFFQTLWRIHQFFAIDVFDLDIDFVFGIRFFFIFPDIFHREAKDVFVVDGIGDDVFV